MLETSRPLRHDHYGAHVPAGTRLQLHSSDQRRSEGKRPHVARAGASMAAYMPFSGGRPYGAPGPGQGSDPWLARRWRKRVRVGVSQACGDLAHVADIPCGTATSRNAQRPLRTLNRTLCEPGLAPPREPEPRARSCTEQVLSAGGDTAATCRGTAKSPPRPCSPRLRLHPRVGCARRVAFAGRSCRRSRSSVYCRVRLRHGCAPQRSNRSTLGLVPRCPGESVATGA